MHSPVKIPSENDNLLDIEGCMETVAQQESAHLNQAEVHDGLIRPSLNCWIHFYKRWGKPHLLMLFQMK